MKPEHVIKFLNANNRIIYLYAINHICPKRIDRLTFYSGAGKYGIFPGFNFGLLIFNPFLHRVGSVCFSEILCL
jgi:hypothetical protein